MEAIAYRVKEQRIFLCGIAKNERDNIDADDLEILKKLARQFKPGVIRHARENDYAIAS